MADRLVPLTRSAARRFIADHHRHNEPPVGWLFGVGLQRDGELRAVGCAGRPVARGLADGRTVEITRVCTLGDRNAASRIYGALCRAAAALGYDRAITYSLASESGSSIRAAGFVEEARIAGHAGWTHTAGPRAGDQPRLWEAAKMPTGPKVRWTKTI